MSNIFEIRSISKTYRQANREIVALQNVSLDVEQGDIYGIIELSGAGKSTLIRSLARLVKPDSGKILFQGGNIEEMEGKDLRNFRKNIGMIFQHFNLLSSRNTAGNIAYPLEIADIPIVEQQKRVDELLGLVGLEKKKHFYPSQLSGGEKQRVGIARALAHRPQALLCDEATSSLDPKTTKEILTLLKTINRTLGTTIILITHEMDVVKHICNKVAVLEKGEIVEEGFVTEIFADPAHPTTQKFLQTTSHDIPLEFFKGLSPNKKLLRLRFKGKVAGKPIISHIVREFHVNANILLGWIDNLQTLIVGTLIIELTGDSENIQKTLEYLQQQEVHFDEPQQP